MAAGRERDKEVTPAICRQAPYSPLYKNNQWQQYNDIIMTRVCLFCIPDQSALSWQLLEKSQHEVRSRSKNLFAMERYESDYSDDFEEEELSSAAAASSKPLAGSLYVGGGRPPPRRKRREQPALQETRGRRGGEDRYSEEKFTTPIRQRGLAGPPPSKSRSTGAVSTTRRRGFGDQQSSRRSFLPRRLEPAGKAGSTGASPARDRQLSAMNHKVRGLQNRLAERERQLEEVSRENRLLTRLQKKQDKEWTRIQRQEDELPHILSRHEQEVHIL